MFEADYHWTVVSHHLGPGHSGAAVQEPSAASLAGRECVELLIVSRAEISHNPLPLYPPPTSWKYSFLCSSSKYQLVFLSNSLMELRYLAFNFGLKGFINWKKIDWKLTQLSLFFLPINRFINKNWVLRLFLKQLKLSVISVRMRVHRPRIEQGRQRAWSIITSKWD